MDKLHPMYQPTRWNCEKCFYRDSCKRNLTQGDCDKFQEGWKEEGFLDRLGMELSNPNL